MAEKCPRCLQPLYANRDSNQILDYDVVLWRCSNCLNEYVD